MKKNWRVLFLLMLSVVFVGCSQTGQKEPVPYSKMVEFEEQEIESVEDVTKELGKPSEIITNVNDMEAIAKGYRKDLVSPESPDKYSGDISEYATATANKYNFNSLVELTENNIELISSLKDSENFKALKYKAISSENDEYDNYYIFSDDEFILNFWTDNSYK